MGAGRIVAIIGAVVGILSITLGFILPDLMSWYRSGVSALGIFVGYSINGFGMLVGLGGAPPPPPEFALLFMVLIAGILVLIGAVLLIIGAAAKTKALGVIGGILMLLGPILFLVDLFIGISDLSTLYPPGELALWGSIEILPGVTYNWGVWIGFFMAIGGGVVGLIGGALID